MTVVPISAIPSPALVIGPEGRIDAANAGARAALGNVVGQPVLALVVDAAEGDALDVVRRPPTLQGLDATYATQAEAFEGGALVLLTPSQTTDALPPGLLAQAIDAANNAVVVTDVRAPDAPLCYVNGGFRMLTGYTADEAIGRNCRFLQVRDGLCDDTGDGQAEALDQIRHAVRHGEPLDGVVLRNYTKAGELFYNELFLTPIHDAHGALTHMVGVQNDVTRWRLAAAAEATERAHFDRVFDASAAPMGLLERGADGIVVTTANPAARQSFGGAIAEAAMGQTWQSAVACIDRDGRPARFDVALDDGRTLEVVLSPVPGDREQFLYMATDVTDGREATEDLLHVSNRQLQQIAQDIHDGVGQSLVGASMLASALARDLDASPQAADARQLQQLLGRSLGSLRSFALGLDPVDIDRLGVGEALMRLVAEAQATFNIDIRVTDRVGGRGVRPDARLDVYRVAQEALTNAVRHGGARSVRLALYPGPDGDVVLDVVDDGSGIEAGASASGGMGMRTMRARAQRHGGRVAVEALGGGGTRVRLWIPAERLFTG
ncbi:PAS domain-containing protein [Rubrivirga sp. IMCC43871]|uniref:PAS domain-containing protein n=1 Tax=Rubrivirga sp. IMCC43871 TaxID=3391575 RepID=UPI00398FBFF0